MSSAPNFDLFARPVEPERPLGVSELNDRAAGMLESKFARILVEGEVSGFLAHRSGHWYFTLKDHAAQLTCCFFKTNQRGVVAPKDGDKVIVRGKLTVYSQRGTYQFVIEHLKPAGAGALLQKLEALKQKLSDEGLLALERKRPLPRVVHNVGIVTSPDGAVVRDFIRVARERDPTLRIVVLPTPVQGPGSANEIARMIRFGSENAERLKLDMLVIARGGGSIEDLWSFNEEVVARAIAACRIPTVSAIGHEVDVTVADLVADVRAPTPTAAAQMTAADIRALWRAFGDHGRRMTRALRADLAKRMSRMQRARIALSDPMRRLQRLSQRIDDLNENIERALRDRLRAMEERVIKAREVVEANHPRLALAAKARQVAMAERAINQSLTRLVHKRREQLGRSAARLDALSPLGVLGRGYAIAINDETGKAVRSPADAPEGTKLTVRVAEGSLKARVEK